MKKVVKGILIVLLVLVIAFVGMVAVLTITEFKPDDVETVAVDTKATKNLTTTDTFTVMSWNIGYGALGDNADFFLDGGDSVMTADEERVYENMAGILSAVEEVSPDIMLFQEVDRNSTRSHKIDEADYLLDGLGYVDSSFAYNYRSLFVPYPIPPIGTVNAGLLTTSVYEISEATRYQLPSPYSWPMSLGNLKRCLVVNRIPLEDSDKELVIVNLHLEAYDSGEGKIAQTKMLKEILNAEVEAGNYVIAGGDFNQIFSNVDDSAYPIYDGMWEPGVIDVDDFEGWQMLMDNSVASCRSLDQPYAGADTETFQYYIIDGFIVSSNLTVDSMETLDYDFVSSDHNPILMTVHFAE